VGKNHNQIIKESEGAQRKAIEVAGVWGVGKRCNGDKG
jgi:hypothetical protein